MANVAQRSFGAGELSPMLYARTDLEKYGAGARTIRNFVVRRQGGLENRAGTELVGLCPAGSTAARLIPFVFNEAQAYALEFSDLTLRFVKAGAYLGAPYTLASPYRAADLFQLQWSQSADVVTLTHPNYPPYELKRYADTTWTLTPAVYAPSIGGVSNIAASGGAAGPATWWAVTAVSSATGEEGLPVFFSTTNKVPASGTPTTVTWDPLGGALGYVVYRSPDGVTYGQLGPAAGAPQAKSTTTWSSTAASVTTSTHGTPVASGGQARSAAVAAIADKAYDGQYTIIAAITLTAVGGGGSDYTTGRLRIYYSRGGEPRVDAGILSDTPTVLGAATITRAIVGTFFVPDNGYSTLTIDLVPEVIGSAGGTSFTFSVSTSAGPTNLIAWSVTKTGYVDLGSAPNYGIAPPTQRTLFAAVGDYPSAVGMYQQRRVFGGSLNNPETLWASRSASYRSFTVSSPSQDDDAVTFALVGKRVNQIRHVVDASVFLVLTSGGEWIIDGDTTGVLRPTEINARNFSDHGAALLPPIKIDRRVLYVQARQSIIRDIAKDPFKGYLGTDLTTFANHLFEGYTLTDWAYQEIPHSIVWVVRSDGTLLGLTDVDDENVRAWHRHDTLGTVESCCVIPEGTEDRLYLVVNRAGVRMVERMASRFIPNVQDAILTDSTLSFDGRNTNPAKTITLSGGTDWAAGTLLTATASLAAFAAGNVGDQVVVTAADGSTVRCQIALYGSPSIVQVYPQSTVPASLQNAATAAWSLAVRGVSGLAHLEGRAVSVVADGTVVANPNNPRYTTVCMVTGGAITFDRPYSYIHVGLPYVSDLLTLDVDTPEGPSLRERPLLINKVTLEVVGARGIWAGAQAPASDSVTDGLLPFKLRDRENFGEPVRLTTGVIRITIPNTWDRTKNGQVFIRQVDPVPLTILAAIPTGNIPPAPAQ